MLAILTNSLYTKLLIYSYVKSPGPKMIRFLETVLIIRSSSRPKYSDFLNETNSRNKAY